MYNAFGVFEYLVNFNFRDLTLKKIKKNIFQNNSYVILSYTRLFGILNTTHNINYIHIEFSIWIDKLKTFSMFKFFKLSRVFQQVAHNRGIPDIDIQYLFSSDFSIKIDIIFFV